MTLVILLLVGAFEAVGIVVGLHFYFKKNNKVTSKAALRLESDVAARRELLEQCTAVINEMVDLGEVRSIVSELIAIQESLRAERGRITITQAELDTVEGRLRELEEIERELEASGIETKEELKILQKKEKDLRTKNENLQQQISVSVAQLDQLMGEVELSTQVQAQVLAMKTELMQTEEQVATLLLNIEEGNEQYFIMKKRYDALDIEYAQLYERFSETEAATAKS